MANNADDNAIRENSITLGSLFDGIGAFPYAASFFGITPLWASEILPNSVSITKKHFPEMEHLGDITKLDGGKIPPVSIVCFGSPCQSFSIAGPRTSFNGKSGLFFEAIRIIREMRAKTENEYPKLAIFENVPGVLNIDSGRSYKTIIEAFTETEVPMPASGKWANAGMVRGGSVDFAWVVKDAQYYRTPQRRKRLLAIADFTGRRSAEILFKSESLSGYFAARELARQGVTADAPSGINGAGCGFDGYNANLTGNVTATLGVNCGMSTGRNGVLQSERENQMTVAAFMAGQAKNARSIAYNETLSPTLKGAASGLNQTPSVLCVATGQADAISAAVEDLSPTLTLNHEAPYICKEQTAYGICSQSSNSMKSDNPFSGIYETEMSKTLDTTCANPACNQGGIAVVEPKIARTLTARHDSSPCADRGQNVVVFTQNQRDEVRDLNDLAGCLTAKPGVKQQTYVIQSDNNSLTPWDLQQSRIHTPNGTSPTLAGADGGGGRNLAGLVMTEIHPDVAGTLLGSGAGMSRAAGHGGETDLAVVYPAFCLQGNMIGRADKNGPQGKGVNEEISFTLNTIDKHAVAVDCRNYKEIGGKSGTLQAKTPAGYSLNYQNPVRIGYVIRRLTPTECERLMAFPDGYTEIGHDGKVMSDSTRYQMLGNSIVVNVLAYIMQNVAEQLGSIPNGLDN
jgi:DNA (cytosine-5)-methyltransferase 1